MIESPTILITGIIMQPLLNIAISAARQAGDIIMRHAEHVHRVKVLPKGESDFYTEIDVKAEQAIVEAIHKAYPDHGIIAEESGSYREDSEYVWIIDPLDGTKNYLHGFPFYAVSIALRIKNRIEHAVVYDPLRHECFSASRGRGARLNDHRMRVSKTTQLNIALLGSGFPVRNVSLSERYMKSYEGFVGQCAGIRSTGSAALDLAYVATGRLDGFWAFSMQPWDIAAGSLLVQEAGGLISDLHGGETYLEQGDVIAGTPKVFKSVLQTVRHGLKL